MKTRVCRGVHSCGKRLAIKKFYTAPSRSDGYSQRCIKCERGYSKWRYHNVPGAREKRIASARRHYWTDPVYRANTIARADRERRENLGARAMYQYLRYHTEPEYQAKQQKTSRDYQRKKR